MQTLPLTILGPAKAFLARAVSIGDSGRVPMQSANDSGHYITNIVPLAVSAVTNASRAAELLSSSPEANAVTAQIRAGIDLLTRTFTEPIMNDKRKVGPHSGTLVYASYAPDQINFLKGVDLLADAAISLEQFGVRAAS